MPDLTPSPGAVELRSPSVIPLKLQKCKQQIILTVKKSVSSLNVLVTAVTAK